MKQMRQDFGEKVMFYFLSVSVHSMVVLLGMCVPCCFYVMVNTAVDKALVCGTYLLLCIQCSKELKIQ